MVTKAARKPVWDFRRGVATARVLVQLGLDRGLNLDTLLRHTGIAPELLDAPQGEIDATQEIQLIRNLQADLPQVETLGLEAGTRYHVTTYGLWGYAVLSSPTLGSAFGMAARMLNQRGFSALICFGTVLVIYFVISWSFSRIGREAERKLVTEARRRRPRAGEA